MATPDDVENLYMYTGPFNFNLTVHKALLGWAYLIVGNRINLKRYEVFSDQIVQFNEQYNVLDKLLKFIRIFFIITGRQKAVGYLI